MISISKSQYRDPIPPDNAIPMSSSSGTLLNGIYQGALSLRVHAIPAQYHRGVGVERLDLSVIDSKVRAVHAAQLSKEILELHSDVTSIAKSTLPPALVSLAVSSTTKASVHNAITDYVQGIRDMTNITLAARELYIPLEVLKTRIMHYAMNIVPVASVMYTNGIKDRTEIVSLRCTSYNIDDNRNSPVNIMAPQFGEPESQTEYVQLSDINECAQNLLTFSKK